MYYLKKLLLILNHNEKYIVIKLILLKLIEISLEIIGIGLIFPIILILQDINKVLESVLFKKFGNSFIEENLLSLILLTLLIIFIVKNFFGLFVTSYQYKVFSRIKERLSTDIFKKLVQRSEYSSYSPVEAMRHIIHDCNGIINLILSPSIVLISEVIFCIFSIGLIIYINPKSSLFIFFIIIVFILIIKIIISKIPKDLGAEARESDQLMHHYISEIFSGLLEFRIYQSFNNKIVLFNNSLSDNNKIHLKQNIYSSIPRLSFELLFIFVFCCSIAFFSISEISLNEILPTITLYVVITFKLLPTVNKINQSYNSYKFGNDALISTEKLLNSVPIKIKKIIPLNKSISFNNISFGYNEKYLIEKLSLKIDKYDCIGIIGKSGSGKTTLVNIISGLIKPNKGEIFLDDIRFDCTDHTLSIGYVPQIVNILDASLIDNIIYDRLFSINQNYNRIIDVLKMASLTEFIDSNGQVINIQCGNSGRKISGGQRQRIGIARALLFEPSFLIFDESTSSLDSENEKNVLETISSLVGKFTILLISHKPSSLIYCNKIYTLRKSLFSV